MSPANTTASGPVASLLQVFRARVTDAPDAAALIYFDDVISTRELDDATDALAVALSDGGFVTGDRLAIYLQNMPQYVMALLAAWKLGGTAVPINPMLTPGEVAKLVTDSAPRVLIALDELYTPQLTAALHDSTLDRTITTSALDWQHDGDSRVLPATRGARGPEDLRELIDGHLGRRPAAHTPAGADVAVITYTSGTTGKPKGAMNTHTNVLTGGQSYTQWFTLDHNDVVLGVAPLFHVTGLSGHIAAAMTAGAPLVLCYRFDLGVVVDLVRRHRVTFTVAALTVFIALTESSARKEDLATMTTIASGGAPVAAGVLTRFEDRFGSYVHNVYGMTETTAPVLAVPMGSRAPVDPHTSALSVGRPLSGVEVAVCDDAGHHVGCGVIGELAVRGAQVIPGYWRQPDHDATAFRDSWLLTGDVGYVDDQGWYYLVDRKKDMIVASGYKVWPREVEDVLYMHDAVLEAAVVGEPDPYRGETVKAYVSLREGRSLEPADLITFCKARLAAYKYPRTVEIVSAIPKTATGKVLRRELRTPR